MDPRTAKRPMNTVAMRDAAHTPIRPQIMAKKAKPPVIGCRIRVHVRLCRTFELRLTLGGQRTDGKRGDSLDSQHRVQVVADGASRAPSAAGDALAEDSVHVLTAGEVRVEEVDGRPCRRRDGREQEQHHAGEAEEEAGESLRRSSAPESQARAEISAIKAHGPSKCAGTVAWYNVRASKQQKEGACHGEGRGALTGDGIFVGRWWMRE